MVCKWKPLDRRLHHPSLSRKGPVFWCHRIACRNNRFTHQTLCQSTCVAIKDDGLTADFLTMLQSNATYAITVDHYFIDSLPAPHFNTITLGCAHKCFAERIHSTFQIPDTHLFDVCDQHQGRRR